MFGRLLWIGPTDIIDDEYCTRLQNSVFAYYFDILVRFNCVCTWNISCDFWMMFVFFFCFFFPKDEVDYLSHLLSSGGCFMCSIMGFFSLFFFFLVLFFHRQWLTLIFESPKKYRHFILGTVSKMLKLIENGTEREKKVSSSMLKLTNQRTLTVPAVFFFLKNRRIGWVYDCPLAITSFVDLVVLVKNRTRFLEV